jgi:signal peptidase I
MNFALLLFLLLVVSGAMWLLDVLVLAPRRAAAARAQLAQFDAINGNRLGVPPEVAMRERVALEEELTRRPWYMEYTASFFPVILVVFVLRSFLFEPFRIPSSSMVPTLLIGDLILVNKYTYGIRLPVINRKLVEINQPARGDVMVFRYPHNPSQDYIKRVIALPGDRVAYINRQLMLNGQPVPAQALPRYLDDERLQHYAHFSEKLGTVEHRIIMNEGAGMPPMRAFAHTHPDACKYSVEGVACVVPAGHYFVMGDNRDNSEDSRYWGFVPDENIVGRAFFIWMSLRGWMPSFDRFGRFN